jgi:hypothetical protein
MLVYEARSRLSHSASFDFKSHPSDTLNGVTKSSYDNQDVIWQRSATVIRAAAPNAEEELQSE